MSEAALVAGLLLVGFLVAVPTSMVGLGGGIVFIPLLILAFGLPPNQAVAASLVAMLGTTVSSSASYLRQRRVSFRLALLYDVMDFPGVYLGAWMTTVLDARFMVGVVGVVLFAMGASLLRRNGGTGGVGAPGGPGPSSPEEEAEPGAEPGAGAGAPAKPAPAEAAPAGTGSRRKRSFVVRSVGLALASSFLSGLVSGLAGVGGGTTDTTTMILLGVPPHVAGPTSEFAMAFTNVLAVAAHALLGNVNWTFGLSLAAGTVFGAQVGAHYSKRVRAVWLLRMLVGFAWLTGARLLLSAFGAF
ncbi:MAG: hypothetical protein Kow0069_29230 [Promethearchaeota archaeon]